MLPFHAVGVLVGVGPAGAVRGQVWTAVRAYPLVRFGAFLIQWRHSFTRLCTLLRAAGWQQLDLRRRLDRDGTAGGGGRFLGTPEQSDLPGLT